MMIKSPLRQNKSAFFNLTVLALAGALFLTACEHADWGDDAVTPSGAQHDGNPSGQNPPGDSSAGGGDGTLNPPPPPPTGPFRPTTTPKAPGTSAGPPNTGGSSPSSSPGGPSGPPEPPVGPAPPPSPPPGPDPALIERGSAIFNEKTCANCHTTGVGPALNGIYQSKGEDYVRRAITDPNADIAEGYQAAMPPLPVTDEELNALIAYIQSLQ